MPPLRPDLTPRELLLDIARCPTMKAHLEGEGGDPLCREVVLHQWQNVPDLEARKRRWRREHHTPVPWVGHLETAPILFVSSNPNLAPNDLRKPKEEEIPDPEPLEGLRDATLEEHPSLRKPFRAPKRYWDPDEVVDYYENHFGVWVKDDGATPLSATSRRRAKVPYWAFSHCQAQELFPDRLVRAGVDYSVTEVVHCKSGAEDGVDDALEPCADRYLHAVLSTSPARVVVAVGVKAAKAFEGLKVERDERTPVTEITLGGSPRLLLFLPHPTWLRRQPKEVAEALVLPAAVSPENLAELRAAVLAAS